MDASETNEDSGGVPYDLLIFLSLFRSGTTPFINGVDIH